METAVKERLIGAAVLVLLVVLVVPALLSGPREPPPPNPAGQGPIRSVEIDMGRSRPLSEPEEPPPADHPLLRAVPFLALLQPGQLDRLAREAVVTVVPAISARMFGPR